MRLGHRLRTILSILGYCLAAVAAVGAVLICTAVVLVVLFYLAAEPDRQQVARYDQLEAQLTADLPIGTGADQVITYLHGMALEPSYNAQSSALHAKSPSFSPDGFSTVYYWITIDLDNNRRLISIDVKKHIISL